MDFMDCKDCGLGCLGDMSQKKSDETHEGGKMYEHSLDHALEFFSKAGSLFAGRESFYTGDESALSLFQKSWIVDKALTMKLLLWLRDCRGGAGNRSGARECYYWLAKHDPEWLIANIGWLPLVGRWDDLRALFKTGAEEYAVRLWADAIRNGDVIAAKWAKREDAPLQKEFGLTIANFRRLIASIRKDHIVEHKMCTKRWNEINYETVPSVAMARYTKAFGRNDEERFEQYKGALVKGEAEVKASVLFPHDCVRTAQHGDTDIADAQFEAMPNFMEGTDEKIIVISDTSGSMDSRVSGSIKAVDISQGLALYCSGKIPEDNPFHKQFIGFCSESAYKDWQGMTFSEAIRNRQVFDRAIGGTRIDNALILILSTAKYFKLEQRQMPTTLLIVSDMQFHQGVRGEGTEVEKCIALWEEAGYKAPKIIYWNTAGYAGAPSTAFGKNTAMVSGFSTGILKAILSGEDFSPIAVMLRALEKYDIVKPE
jgi:hypothetical protein